MKYSASQEIQNGSNNIQTGRDANIININCFKTYKPHAIRFYEKDICTVIEAFNVYVDEIKNDLEKVDLDREFQLTEKPKKNKLNNLSEEYFKMICEEYLPYFNKIDVFLRAPQNKAYLNKYRKTVAELKFRISTLRKHYEYFEDVLTAILNEVLNSGNDSIIEHRDVFIIFINYMYWNCDIGRRK